MSSRFSGKRSVLFIQLIFISDYCTLPNAKTASVGKVTYCFSNLGIRDLFMASEICHDLGAQLILPQSKEETEQIRSVLNLLSVPMTVGCDNCEKVAIDLSDTENEGELKMQ